ncbi:hypothetical protein [Nostoc sp.]
METVYDRTSCFSSKLTLAIIDAVRAKQFSWRQFAIALQSDVKRP